MQVLSDAQVYAEHAGRSGTSKIEMDDVVLAVQARVGWEFGGRIPKEHLLSLASQTNATPLPAVPEVFGVRLPPASETLTSVNFELVSNKPPPSVKLYDEEVEEIEEEEEAPGPQEDEEDDADMEPAAIPASNPPVTPTDVEMGTSSPASAPIVASGTADEGSDVAEEADLFGGAGEDEDEDESAGDDVMEEIQTATEPSNGVKRKLVEEEDYD